MMTVTLAMHEDSSVPSHACIGGRRCQSIAPIALSHHWRTAFGARDQGLGSAIAVFLFALVLPVMVLNLRRFRAERG